jgi:hypothetical protein
LRGTQKSLRRIRELFSGTRESCRVAQQSIRDRSNPRASPSQVWPLVIAGLPLASPFPGP